MSGDRESAILSKHEIEMRREHNEAAHVVPDTIKDGMLVGEYVIVRLFMYEAFTQKKGGLILPRYKNHQTEGGKEVARISDDKYEPRGVILKVGNKVEDYEEGDVVYVPLQATVDSSRYFFNTNRSTPVTDFDGTIRIPASTIEFIESRETINSGD